MPINDVDHSQFKLAKTLCKHRQQKKIYVTPTILFCVGRMCGRASVLGYLSLKIHGPWTQTPAELFPISST
jgi:hypothetical protein